MSKVGLEISIDVTKIDKQRLFQGQKGTYLTITAFVDIDQKDQYGNNGMVTQKVSKEEQEQGVKGNILGNSKVFWTDSGQTQQQQNWNQPTQQQQQQIEKQNHQQGRYQQQPQQQNINPQSPTIDFDDDVAF